MIRAKKSLGQHFLKNPHVVDHMITAGGVAQGDTVFEIGPGTGILTHGLLEAGAHVIAAEADARAITVLKEKFHKEIANGQLVLHHVDIRTADISSFGLEDHQYKAVANIPYYLSGMLFEKILSSNRQPATLVFLVQKEVAERIACLRRGRGRQAKVAKESLLSLSIKIYGTPTYVKTVPRGNFSPSPSVDSAVLKVSDISRTRLSGVPEEWFFTLVKAGFASKRKQLLGNLLYYLPEIGSKETLVNTFSTLQIPRETRAEDVSLDVWVQLAFELKK